jgi:hypothetical protein
MPEKGHSGLRVCEGKIEGRTSRSPVTPCLHIGFGGAMAMQACAATGAMILAAFEILRGSPARVRWSWRAARS